MIGENAVRFRVTSIWSAAASRPWRMIDAVTGSTLCVTDSSSVSDVVTTVSLLFSVDGDYDRFGSITAGSRFRRLNEVDGVQCPVQFREELVDLRITVAGA